MTFLRWVSDLPQIIDANFVVCTNIHNSKYCIRWHTPECEQNQNDHWQMLPKPRWQAFLHDWFKTTWLTTLCIGFNRFNVHNLILDILSSTEIEVSMITLIIVKSLILCIRNLNLTDPTFGLAGFLQSLSLRLLGQLHFLCHLTDLTQLRQPPFLWRGGAMIRKTLCLRL